MAHGVLLGGLQVEESEQAQHGGRGGALHQQRDAGLEGHVEEDEGAVARRAQLWKGGGGTTVCFRVCCQARIGACVGCCTPSLAVTVLSAMSCQGQQSEGLAWAVQHREGQHQANRPPQASPSQHDCVPGAQAIAAGRGADRQAVAGSLCTLCMEGKAAWGVARRLTPHG